MGQPLCRDCYDCESHLVWQWWAPELWGRFTIDLRRALARDLAVPESRLAELVTVQYAKVAEYQQRGIVHFHALIRLDDPRPGTGTTATTAGFAPAPSGLTAGLLARLVEQAAAGVSFDAPPLHAGDVVRGLLFGTRLDARPVATARRTDDPDRPLTPEQVAGYLAKYATSPPPTPRTPTATTRGGSAPPSSPSPTGSAPTPAVTASRCGSTRTGCCSSGGTCSASAATSPPSPAATPRRSGSSAAPGVRYERALAAANREGRTLDVRELDDLLDTAAEETTLVIGHWTYAGTGWDTDGDTELAKAAAAGAREYAQERAANRNEKY